MNIQKTFEEVFAIVQQMNAEFDNELVSSEDIEDMKSTIHVFLPKYLGYLQDGIAEMSSLNIDSLDNKAEQPSEESFAKLIVGFSNTYYLFEEMDELLTKLNRNFLLKSHMTTLEELQKPYFLSQDENKEL